MASDFGFKRCANCKRMRSELNFYKSSSSKDGLQSYCCDCSTAARRRNLNKSERIPLEPPARKFCTGCLTNKRGKDFYACANTADGLQHRCKECDTYAARERYRKKAKRIAANVRNAARGIQDVQEVQVQPSDTCFSCETTGCPGVQALREDVESHIRFEEVTS